MKIFDHTIYAPNRTTKFGKTSVFSVPSVVNEQATSKTKTYEANRNLIDKVENKFGTSQIRAYDFTNDATGCALTI